MAAPSVAHPSVPRMQLACQGHRRVAGRCRDPIPANSSRPVLTPVRHSCVVLVGIKRPVAFDATNAGTSPSGSLHRAGGDDEVQSPFVIPPWSQPESKGTACAHHGLFVASSTMTAGQFRAWSRPHPAADRHRIAAQPGFGACLVQSGRASEPSVPHRAHRSR